MTDIGGSVIWVSLCLMYKTTLFDLLQSPSRVGCAKVKIQFLAEFLGKWYTGSFSLIRPNSPMGDVHVDISQVRGFDAAQLPVTFLGSRTILGTDLKK